jgi:hypothetical protein
VTAAQTKAQLVWCEDHDATAERAQLTASTTQITLSYILPTKARGKALRNAAATALTQSLVMHRTTTMGPQLSAGDECCFSVAGSIKAATASATEAPLRLQAQRTNV